MLEIGLIRQEPDSPLALSHFTRSDHGTFLTFAPTRKHHDPTCAARLLSSEESQLAAKWTGFVRDSLDSWSWWNWFVSCVTTRIGTDPMIDRAIDFALESYTTFKHVWDCGHDQVAQKRGLAALTTLRHALGATADLDHTTVAITTGLFCVAEVRSAYPSSEPTLTTTSFSEPFRECGPTMCICRLARSCSPGPKQGAIVN